MAAKLVKIFTLWNVNLQLTSRYKVQMGVAVVEGKKPWGFNIFDKNRKSSFYQTWKKFRGELHAG